MIAKDKSAPAPTDKFGCAGHAAEMQMAFYLRRAFAEAPDIYVFNDLRLVRNGEVGQIDHLVFHRYGFVIVESKSVVGTITVNEKGEFTRTYDGFARGMPSPIRQANLQAELLTNLLNEHRDALRRKVFFGLQQGYFGEDRFRVLVAISDHGIITRQNCDPPELCKAERIVEELRELVKRKRHANSIGGFVTALTSGKQKAKEIEDDVMAAYTDDEMTAIHKFFVERHAPLRAPLAEVTPKLEEPPAAQPSPPKLPTVVAILPTATSISCRHCKSTDLTGLHGRYGYFVKCNACQGNPSMDPTCTNCQAKARIQKAGPKFSRLCEACGTQVVVHENAMTSTE